MGTFLTPTILDCCDDETESLCEKCNLRFTALCSFAIIHVIARRMQEIPKCPPSAVLMAGFHEHYRLIFNCNIHLYANNYCAGGLLCVEGAS